MDTQAAVQEAAGLLEFRGITKEFPGVLALDKVSFGIQAGEIHALVGENGAGKSTLVKILTGVTAKDEGEILIEGRSVVIRHVSDAIRLGIRCIYQELPLAGSLSIADNIFLGQELRKTFVVNDREQRAFVKKYFREYSLEINPVYTRREAQREPAADRRDHQSYDDGFEASTHGRADCDTRRERD